VHIWSLQWLHKSAARDTIGKTWCCYPIRTTLTPWWLERRCLEVCSGPKGEGRWYMEDSVEEWLPVEKSMGRFRRAFPLFLHSNTLQPDNIRHSHYVLWRLSNELIYFATKKWCSCSLDLEMVWMYWHLHWGLVLRANWSRMQFWTPLFSFRSSASDWFVLSCTKSAMEDGRCVSEKGMYMVLILEPNAKDYRVSTAHGRVEIGSPSIASSNTYT